MPPKPLTPEQRELYFSDLHDEVIEKIMTALEEMSLPDDVDHRKALSIIFLDMSSIWAVRTGRSSKDHFVTSAEESYEESEIRLNRIPDSAMN